MAVVPPRPDLATQRAAAASTQDALETLETRAGAAAGLAAAAAVGPVIRLIARAWVTLFGSTTAPADPKTLPKFVRQVRVALRAVDTDPSGPVRGAVSDALTLGTSSAADLLGVDVDPPDPSDDLDGVLADLAATVDDAVGEAEDRLPSVRDFDGVAALVGDLKAAETRADALARTAVVRGVSEGVDHVAEVTGSERIWVAERDGACLECLAYQGHVVKAGEDFPGGLTFRVSDKVRFPDPIPGPPRHPHCRCVTQIFRRQWATAGSTSFQGALRREAQRAVLRGDAGESNRARLRAADRLLDRGTALPKTVKERARRAVDAGVFPDRTRGTK